MPTDSPVAPPVFEPTLSPSLRPTWSPTYVPTVPPTDLCEGLTVTVSGVVSGVGMGRITGSYDREATGELTDIWQQIGGDVELRYINHCSPGVPTCYAWNHVVLAPLFFVPNYLMPMFPRANGFTWSMGTYWRAHRLLGLRLHQVPTTGFVMLTRMLEAAEVVHLVGFDGYSKDRELHYYSEANMQLQVNAAGALLHDWGKEQRGIRELMEQGRVVLLHSRSMA